MDFAMKNFRELAVRISKIYLLTFGLFVAALIIIVAPALALGGASLFSGSWALLFPLLALAIVVLLAVGFVNASINMVRFIAVEDVAKKAQTRIIASATPLISSVVVYSIASLLLVVVFVGIPVLLGSMVGFSGSAGTVGLLAFVLAIAFALVFLILFSLFVQFSALEIAINKKGGIEALRSSYALVRNNLAAVIIYDIILFIISFAIGMVFGVINQVLSFGMAMGAFNIALLVIVVCIYAVVVIAESILINTVLTPVEYFFWKSLGGKK